MDYMSWGDRDGLNGTSVATGSTQWISNASTGGYVGIDNFLIGGAITITGTVSIDLLTDDGVSAGMYAMMKNGIINNNPVSTSIVHISFGESTATRGTVGGLIVDVPGPITGDVKLASDPQLNTGVGTLGNFFISAFHLNIYNGSFVDIWAH